MIVIRRSFARACYALALLAVLVTSMGIAVAQDKWVITPGRGGADSAKGMVQIQTLLNENADRKSETTQNAADIDALEGRMGTAEGNISTLQGTVSSQGAAINNNSAAISNNANRIGTLESGLAEVETHAKAPMPGTCHDQNAKLRWNTATSAWECLPEGDPTVQPFAKTNLPTCSASQLLRSNGSGFQCVNAGESYVITESDPKVGAVTSNQFCRGTGSQVTCDQAPPITAETDPQVGGVTNNRLCRGTGTQVNCDLNETTYVARTGDSMSGNLSVPVPVASNHAATKSYVDAVVSAAGGGGGGSSPFCYYTSQWSSCGTGWTQMPGTFFSSNNPHNICCLGGTPATNDALPVGYVVLTGTTYNGNLGGLAGADTKCLAELQNMPWNGKADATERGLLNSNNVKAYICDSSECRKFKAFTRYYASRAQTLSGAPDFSETGPTEAEVLPKIVGSSFYIAGQNIGQNQYYWSGGGIGHSANQRCMNWTSNENQNYNEHVRGIVGNTSNNSTRYSHEANCISEQKLVCIVNT